MEVEFIARGAQQYYGRVIQALGNMKLLVFCNDGFRRLCKIRNTMYKREPVAIGDVVLISYRAYESRPLEQMRGDILHVYPKEHYPRLRADPQFNPQLLLPIEGIQEQKISHVSKPHAKNSAAATVRYEIIDYDEEDDIDAI
jgi:initiation factor 1A